MNELISNHFARHTFITFKLREGMRPDRLCYMTGHADDRMIREVYEHLTKTDKIKAVKKEKERISGKAANSSMDGEIIAEKTRENYQLRKHVTKLETEKEISENKKDLILHKQEMFEQLRRIGMGLIRDGIINREDANDDPISAYMMMYGNIPSAEEYMKMIAKNEEMNTD